MKYFMKNSACIAIVLATATFTHGVTYDVYDTKVSAKTSTIKELSIKVNKLPVKIHYRAPVSKSYTIVFAYDGKVSPDGNSYTGHGRMWSNDKQTNITFTGEPVYATTGYTRDSYFSSVGPKNQHLPWYRAYENTATLNAPKIYFKGLGTIDRVKLRVSSSSGIVRGLNIYPARCAKCPDAEQGVASIVQQTSYTEDEVRGLWEKDSTIWECLYPMSDDEWELSHAHFHGTYTMRLNTNMSKIDLNSFQQMRELVNARCPMK